MKKEKLIALAKEKGFVSNIIGKSVESIYSNKDFYYLWMCELQKWLREVHDKHPTIHKVTENSKVVGYTYLGTPFNKENTYEEALEKWLQEVLKLI